MPDTLLVIEDESLLGEELSRHFRREGWEVARAATLAEAEAQLREGGLAPLVVLSDMTLPDGNALDLLARMRKEGPVPGEWIFLTGYGTIPDSVRALRLGAFEFLEKPCDIERLDLVVAGAARGARAQRRLREQSAQEHRRYGPEAFVGSSSRTRQVRDLLERLARVPFSAVVIGGETGTGKGLAARILHHSGPHADAPLVEINCAALPQDLLESELFGHEAGAFTGAKGRHRGLIEQAHGGTLHLDEIGEMALGLQAKLLKAIEDRRIRRLGGEREVSVDLQLVASSNRDLAVEVKGGRFREDLYHRLSVLRVDLPALRERLEDLEELVPMFLAEYNLVAARNVRVVPDGVWEQLRAYSWPGNVRELRNVIERCVLLSEDERFPEQWLQLPAGGAAAAPEPRAGAREVRIPLDGSVSLEDMEKHVIRVALERCDHNVTAAARSLGITRQTLRYRIQKHGL
jgi:DNA-binding NtrC family response regulator